MQKKSLFFYSFPSERNFDEVKITNKRAEKQISFDLFSLLCHDVQDAHHVGNIDCAITIHVASDVIMEAFELYTFHIYSYLMKKLIQSV